MTLFVEHMEKMFDMVNMVASIKKGGFING